jgi:predicted aspartyl protease
MPHRWAIALILLAMIGPCAADCGTLKLLASVRMQPLGSGPLMLVPVRIDGVAERFLFDSGGSLSQLMPAAAKDLQLASQPAKVRLYDIYGNSTARQVTVARLAIGDLETRDLTLWIAPARQGDDFRWDFFRRPRWRPHGGIDGVLAPDLLGDYDIELDFADNTLKFLSQDHCEGRVIYWRAANMAVVPMQFRNLQISVAAVLDGHALTALLDTGSPRSTVSLDTAQDVFHLMPGAGLSRTGRLGTTDQPVYSLRLHQLSFDGVRVDNPVFDVIPDLMRPKSQAADAASQVALPSMLLGMDILRKLHLYIAFGEGKIYVTEASR